MRQRLLLVAGWLFAAIGAGLVASAAVAIAGGQVLDRPLRPLTAAEVAALPVPSVGSSELFEPQASGGTKSTTGGPTEGSAAAPNSTPQDAVTQDVPTADVTISTEDAPRSDRFTNLSTSQSDVVVFRAGKASFAVLDDHLYALWTTPSSGYVVSRLKTTDTSITISFASSDDFWLVEANLIDNTLTVSTTQAPVA